MPHVWVRSERESLLKHLSRRSQDPVRARSIVVGAAGEHPGEVKPTRPK